MEQYEFHAVSSIFPLMQGEVFEAFIVDVQIHGLREPIWLYQGKVIDGRNRYRACQRAAVEPHFREWKGKGSPIAFVLSENLHRRHLDESGRAMVAARAKPLFEKEAKERLHLSNANRANLPHSDKGKARDHAAKAVNVSPRIVESASRILRTGSAELIGAVDSGLIPVSGASQLVDESVDAQRAVLRKIESGEVSSVKRAKVFLQAEALNKKPPPLPTGPFDVIVIDPPWRYDNREEDPTHRTSNPYPDQSVDQIQTLGIPALAADDAILWLWTTNAHLPVAFCVLTAWGFQYKTMLTWVKDRMGTGDWLRGQTEHCLMAIRGKPVVTLTNQTTVVCGPLRQHSRKPDQFYALVESLCPGSKVELFGREHREGWVTHGDQSRFFSPNGTIQERAMG